MSTLDDPEHKVIAERLRWSRVAAGLTQEQVSSALGVARTTVAEMEAGRRKVSGIELRKLARLYYRDVGWLLGSKPDTEDKLRAALGVRWAALSDVDRATVLAFAEFLASRHRGDPGA